MAGDQDEAVAKPLLGVADVPPHHPAEQGDHQGVDLGPRSAGVAALAVVEHKVNKLINQVLDFLPLGEMGGQFFVSGCDLFVGCHSHWMLLSSACTRP